MNFPKFFVAMAFMTALGSLAGVSAAQPSRKCGGMSVRDIVKVSRFLRIGKVGGGNRHVLISPNRRYVAIVIQDVSTASDDIVDKLKVWSRPAIHHWLKFGGQAPRSLFTFVRSSSGKFSYGRPAGFGAAIRRVKWAHDSERLYLLGRRPGRRAFGLYEVNLNGRWKRLSSRNQNVRYYSVQRSEVVYETIVTTRKVLDSNASKENMQPYFDGTGLSLPQILFPEEFVVSGTDQVHIWRWSHGTRIRVHLKSKRWEVRDDSKRVLRISPSQDSIIMNLPVRYVPRKWMRYGRRSGFQIWTRVGRVHFSSVDQWVPHQYVIVNLKSGKMRALVGGPGGMARGFYHSPGYSGKIPALPNASWSPHGSYVLLSNTFLANSSSGGVKGTRWGFTRPCLAVVDINTLKATCANTLLSRSGRPILIQAQWKKGSHDYLLLTWKVGRSVLRAPYCLHPAAARWVDRCGDVERVHVRRTAWLPHVWVAQSLNSPPEIMATISANRKDEVLYDPNAKLRGMCRGSVRIVKIGMQIPNGPRKLVAIGLLLPNSYIPGHRYPLIIQTHGFEPKRFMSTGYSVPFVARAFAASGMAVMQLPSCSWRRMGKPISGSPEELPCDVSFFRNAIRYGITHGFVEAHNIGIIGFSATCEEVLAALENGGFHFSAAELVDGDVGTYSQYVDFLDYRQGYSNVADVGRFGGLPIGSGLSGWISRAPGFSLYKIKSPILIEANGRLGSLWMWEPYAILRRLGRPVDLVVMQKGTHPFSNPRQQMASEGLGVAWFRFWLEGKCPSQEKLCLRWKKLQQAE